MIDIFPHIKCGEKKFLSVQKIAIHPLQVCPSSDWIEAGGNAGDRKQRGHWMLLLPDIK